MSKYAKGGDLSKVSKATDTPAVDLKMLLAVDSSNPFIRTLRIQQGFLKAEVLPSDLRGIVPRLPSEEK
ncbi:MAG: hypothetical protein WAV27_15345 [Xanthobacteraceae bacterium]|jgi:hypothetical protein